MAVISSSSPAPPPPVKKEELGPADPDSHVDQSLFGLHVGVFVLHFGRVLFWKSVQIDGNADEQSSGSKRDGWKKKRFFERTFIKHSPDEPAVLDNVLTDLQSKQHNGCYRWDNDGQSGREALHDIIRVLHHHGCVKTTDTGQNWKHRDGNARTQPLRKQTNKKNVLRFRNTHKLRSTPTVCNRRRTLSPGFSPHRSCKHQPGWSGCQTGTSGCFSPTETYLSSSTLSQNILLTKIKTRLF